MSRSIYISLNTSPLHTSTGECRKHRANGVCSRKSGNSDHRKMPKYWLTSTAAMSQTSCMTNQTEQKCLLQQTKRLQEVDFPRFQLVRSVWVGLLDTPNKRLEFHSCHTKVIAVANGSPAISSQIHTLFYFPSSSYSGLRHCPRQ